MFAHTHVHTNLYINLETTSSNKTALINHETFTICKDFERTGSMNTKNSI